MTKNGLSAVHSEKNALQQYVYTCIQLCSLLSFSTSICVYSYVSSTYTEEITAIFVRK